MPTYNDNVTITGSSDETQLVVTGYTTQTESLQEWQDSSGDPVARLTGDGRLQVGSFVSGVMATDESLIEAHRAETDTSKPKRGFHLLGAISGALSTVVSWVVQELTLKGASGVSALHTALRVRLRNEATGTPVAGGELRGGDIEVTHGGGSSGSPLPSVTGLRVAVTQETSASSAALHGLKVEVPAAATGIYALHTTGGKVHLDGLSNGLVQADSNGDLASLALGTAGQQLRVNMGATAPEWFTATQSNMTVDWQVFSTSGSTTWTKPAQAKLVRVILCGGGGGGGSGRQGAVSTAKTGGGGGGAGLVTECWYDASELPNTSYTVLVGAGGTGGASSATSGNIGNNGSDSYFGGSTEAAALQVAKGGTGGGPGTSTVAGTAGIGGTTWGKITQFYGADGGVGVANATAGDGGVSALGPGGGGGGSGRNASNVPAVAGAGGRGNGARFGLLTGGGGTGGGGTGSVGTNGTNGGSGVTDGSAPLTFGGGGGGGGFNVTTASNGGNGGFPGGGGGGGAASQVSTSGAGGNGGVGAVIVVSYCYT